ncbi:unnamed protein product [Vitrella brassicaformis CCMP3155]|uniref:FAD-binding domain-containing protein n=4 Tax=Vitrella brassicaformis TaxID=1169539 RepID=A0A0G4EPQ2_VITBC|nr:unnamed protein product [Vitrella brassicaformis CCMP3155]|eukprot:CEL99541.1 unnamed protein product [Vitrella brassicaformis CCMP3155]
MAQPRPSVEQQGTYVNLNTPRDYDIPPETEVIISGCSVTALTLACELNRRGVEWVMLKNVLRRGHWQSIGGVRNAELRVSPATIENGECYGILGVTSRSIEVFEDLGVLDDVKEAGIEEVGERIFVDGELAVDWRYNMQKMDSAHPFAILVEQSEIERILLKHIIDSGNGHRIKGPVDLTEISQDSQGVTVQFQPVVGDGEAKLPPGSIRGMFLVGSDGSNSFVRRSCGMGWPFVCVRTAKFVIADVSMDWSVPPDENKASLYFRRGRAMMVVRLRGEGDKWRILYIHHVAGKYAVQYSPDGDTNQPSTVHHMEHPEPPQEDGASVAGSQSRGPAPEFSDSGGMFSGIVNLFAQLGISLEKGESEFGKICDNNFGAKAPTKDDLEFMIQRIIPVAKVMDVHWMSWTPVICCCAASFQKGRVFIAGDAAHIHAPLFHQGMNTGIQDAHNLGWKIAQVVRGGAYPVLIDSYNGERQPVNDHIRLITSLPGQQVARGNQWVSWAFKTLVPYVLNESGTGWVNGLMTQKLSQIRVRYPTNTLATGRANIRGGLQPGQRIPDGMMAKLDRSDRLTFVRLHEVTAGKHFTLVFTIRLPNTTGKAVSAGPSVAGSSDIGSSDPGTPRSERSVSMASDISSTPSSIMTSVSGLVSRHSSDDRSVAGVIEDLIKSALEPFFPGIAEKTLIDENMLVQGLIRNAVSLAVDTMKRLGVASSTVWGGLRVILAFTAGKATMQPLLPTIKEPFTTSSDHSSGHERHSSPTTATHTVSPDAAVGLHAVHGHGGSPEHHSSQQQQQHHEEVSSGSRVGVSVLPLPSRRHESTLTDTTGKKSSTEVFVDFIEQCFKDASAGEIGFEESDIWVTWDSEGELAQRLRYRLNPRPPAFSFSRGMGVVHEEGSDFTGYTSDLSVVDEMSESTAPSSIASAGQKVGRRYGAFTLVRPDGHVSHNGYLSDKSAREEMTEFVYRYLERKTPVTSQDYSTPPQKPRSKKGSRKGKSPRSDLSKSSRGSQGSSGSAEASSSARA